MFDFNAAKGREQKAQIDRLRRSVELHETLHSTLVGRALKAMEDPAKAVERGMAPNRDKLKERMNFVLRDAHTKFSEGHRKKR